LDSNFSCKSHSSRGHSIQSYPATILFEAIKQRGVRHALAAATVL